MSVVLVKQTGTEKKQGNTEERSKVLVGFSIFRQTNKQKQNVGFPLRKTDNKRSNKPDFGFRFTTLFSSGSHPARIREQTPTLLTTSRPLTGGTTASYFQKRRAHAITDEPRRYQDKSTTYCFPLARSSYNIQLDLLGVNFSSP